MSVSGRTGPPPGVPHTLDRPFSLKPRFPTGVSVVSAPLTGHHRIDFCEPATENRQAVAGFARSSRRSG